MMVRLSSVEKEHVSIGDPSESIRVANATQLYATVRGDSPPLWASIVSSLVYACNQIQRRAGFEPSNLLGVHGVFEGNGLLRAIFVLYA